MNQRAQLERLEELTQGARAQQFPSAGARGDIVALDNLRGSIDGNVGQPGNPGIGNVHNIKRLGFVP